MQLERFDFILETVQSIILNSPWSIDANKECKQLMFANENAADECFSTFLQELATGA